MLIGHVRMLKDFSKNARQLRGQLLKKKQNTRMPLKSKKSPCPTPKSRSFRAEKIAEFLHLQPSDAPTNRPWTPHKADAAPQHQISKKLRFFKKSVPQYFGLSISPEMLNPPKSLRRRAASRIFWRIHEKSSGKNACHCMER